METGFLVGQIGGYSVNLNDVLLRRDTIIPGIGLASGNNFFGALGDSTLTSKSSPIIPINNKWVKISCGNQHTHFISYTNKMYAVGYNNKGQLGDNTLSSKSVPTEIKIPGGITYVDTCSGNAHSMALSTTGGIHATGLNSFGQLGDGTTINRSYGLSISFETDIWKKVAASSGSADHSAAIKYDDTLWVCGRNDIGQLGDGTTVNKSSIVQIAGGGTNWKSVSLGQYHTAAVKTDGTLWTWGDNSLGQLGDGTTVNKSSPIQITGTNWNNIICGDNHTLGIKTDGTLWAWGLNSKGQLGDGTTVDKSSPTQIAGTNWKQVSGGSLHTLGLKVDGTLWTWGYNNNGQLGDGTTIDKSTPSEVITNYQWKYVAAGSDHSFFLTQDQHLVF